LLQRLPLARLWVCLHEKFWRRRNEAEPLEGALHRRHIMADEAYVIDPDHQRDYTRAVMIPPLRWP
jgi:hypothetical protein